MTSDGTAPTTLEETSPTVQTHLGILQNVIQRMGANSSSSKAWCITVVSAVLVIVADKSNPDFAFLALIPTLLFLALDAYYLALEKGFRTSYNDFVTRLHARTATVEDLYAVNPKGDLSGHQIQALKSFSIWGFYGTLFILILIARGLVLTGVGTGNPL